MKSENILKVIEVFRKVLPMAVRDGHLNMSAAMVTGSKHGCGTIHCHGGWFAIGVCDLTEYVGFDHGAHEMSKMLGFEDFTKLTNWANRNAKLWGNTKGYEIFCGEHAFYHETHRPNGAENLQHIIDHWTEVYERVRANEQPQQPAYENISKSLAVLPIPETSDVVGVVGVKVL